MTHTTLPPHEAPTPMLEDLIEELTQALDTNTVTSASVVRWQHDFTDVTEKLDLPLEPGDGTAVHRLYGEAHSLLNQAAGRLQAG